MAREIAWNRDGKWCGEGVEVQPMPALAVPHGECWLEPGSADCGRFVCSACSRCVSWCCGGEGTRCNDCWHARRQALLERLEAGRLGGADHVDASR